MADSTIPDLTAVTTPASTDEFGVRQSGDTRDKKMSRAQIHSLESGEHLILPQVSEPATPTLAFGDGDSGFYESSDDLIGIAIGGVSKYFIDADKIQSSQNGGFYCKRVTGSSTIPVFSFVNDLNSGFSWQAADNPCVVSGGIESARFEDPADLGAAETSLWIYDDDNAAIGQVTVGAADSGGSGFKVLRIVN